MSLGQATNQITGGYIGQSDHLWLYWAERCSRRDYLEERVWMETLNYCVENNKDTRGNKEKSMSMGPLYLVNHKPDFKHYHVVSFYY